MSPPSRTPAVAVMQSLIGERARSPELASLLDEAARARREGLAEILERATKVRASLVGEPTRG